MVSRVRSVELRVQGAWFRGYVVSSYGCRVHGFENGVPGFWSTGYIVSRVLGYRVHSFSLPTEFMLQVQLQDGEVWGGGGRGQYEYVD